MSIDEPFKLKPDAQRATAERSNQRAIVSSMKLVMMFDKEMKNVNPIRVVGKPERHSLHIDPAWKMSRKITYVRARHANAMQMFRAREEFLRNKNLSIADCINLQRLFECYDYGPPRNWLYYPIVDSLTNMGVPRSQAGSAMLKFPQVAVMVSRQLFIYESSKREFIHLHREPELATPTS